MMKLSKQFLFKKKARASPKFPSSFRYDIDADADADADAEPTSLFVVVLHDFRAQYFCSILQLEPHINNHEPSLDTHAIPTEFSANFSEPLLKPSASAICAFSPLVTSSKAELYIVPDWFSRDSKRDAAPLSCGIFDLRTKTCTPIKAPHSPKYSAHVATVGEHIYFMANPQECVCTSIPLFERYNTLKGSWEVLEPYPPYAVDDDKGHRGNIVATVVFDDTILLSIDGHKIWAYYVPKGEWYIVNVKNKRCYCMIGQTVALKNIIYALPTGKDDKVLELSFERQKINGGLVFTLNLRSEISVPGLKRAKFGVKLKDTTIWTGHFVHLGKDNFCLVQGCMFHILTEYQFIQVTYIKLKGKDSSVTNRCVHKFKIPASFSQFEVGCCFSLPKSKTTVLEEGQRIFTVNIKPGAWIKTPKVGLPTLVACSSVRTKLYFDPKASTHGDGTESFDTDEEGRSTCERCFPPGITLRQFVDELNKIGPEGFRFKIDNIGNLSAYVKFESRAQKRESYFSSDITLGRFVKKVKNYGPDEYRLMIDNNGNFCACLDFESTSYKKHVAEESAKEVLWKTSTESEDSDSDSDDSMSDVDTDSDEVGSFSESDYDEII